MRSEKIKKCCKCHKIVCKHIPIEGMRTSQVKEVVPFKIFKNKYWCEECYKEEVEWDIQ